MFHWKLFFLLPNRSPKLLYLLWEGLNFPLKPLGFCFFFRLFPAPYWVWDLPDCLFSLFFWQMTRTAHGLRTRMTVPRITTRLTTPDYAPWPSQWQFGEAGCHWLTPCYCMYACMYVLGFWGGFRIGVPRSGRTPLQWLSTALGGILGHIGHRGRSSLCFTNCII